MIDGVATGLLYAMMLLLPVSALVARRLPIGPTLKLAAIWVAIFGVVVAVIVLFGLTA